MLLCPLNSTSCLLHPVDLVAESENVGWDMKEEKHGFVCISVHAYLPLSLSLPSLPSIAHAILIQLVTV